MGNDVKVKKSAATSVADLKERLKLLVAHGVRHYRDGDLEIVIAPKDPRTMPVADGLGDKLEV